MIIEVKVVKATGLAPKDPNKKSDPYCKIGIAGSNGEFEDPSKCKKSNICYQTLDPVFKNTILLVYVLLFVCL